MANFSVAEKPSRNLALFIFLALLTLVFYVFIFGSVDKSVTHSDKEAIKKLHVNQHCEKFESFNDEIKCIKAVQDSIRSLIKDVRCPMENELIEPASFISRGYGCCFDRARFTEKTLSYYGFQIRHVALYDRDIYGLIGLLIPGIDSHAATEVKTSKGWMGVDSLYPFLLITKNNEVLTYQNFKNRINDLMYKVEPQIFYEKNLFVIYGLYSRHGFFHGINAPTPEFNFKDILFNL